MSTKINSFDWISFSKAYPEDDSRWVLVCYISFPINEFEYWTTQVEPDSDFNYNLLNIPWSVENGNGELLSWCYVDMPYEKFDDDIQRIIS